MPLLSFGGIDPAVEREGYRAAEEQARQELGDIYKLIDIGEPATIEGLLKELDMTIEGLLKELDIKGAFGWFDF